jgi:hypothetical protein
MLQVDGEPTGIGVEIDAPRVQVEVWCPGPTVAGLETQSHIISIGSQPGSCQPSDRALQSPPATWRTG